MDLLYFPNYCVLLKDWSIKGAAPNRILKKQRRRALYIILHTEAVNLTQTIVKYMWKKGNAFMIKKPMK